MNSLSLACRSLLTVDKHFFAHLSPENRTICDKIADYLFGNGNPVLEQDVCKINASLVEFNTFFNERELVPDLNFLSDDQQDATFLKFHPFQEERPIYAFPHVLEILPERNSLLQLFPEAAVGCIFPVGRSPYVISMLTSEWEKLQKDFPDDYIAIEEHLSGPLTLETMLNAEKMSLLIGWRKVRDTLRVWKVIAQETGAEMPAIKSKKAVEEQMEKWFEKNKDRLMKLSVLGLNHLDLISLPIELIEKCSNLKELYVMFNKLTSLPPTIGKLTSLLRLNVDHNKLLSLPREIGQLTSLRHLDVNDNLLTSLPSEIGQLTSLTYLNVNDNLLTSLPPEIGNLSNLNCFIVENNKLSSMPGEVQYLRSLVIFGFSNNQLLSLPSEIGQLTHLRFLMASKNKLSSVPVEIQHLKSLESLSVSQNQLTSLPSTIGNLTNLTSFQAHRNKLSSVPAEVWHLKSLETLDVSENVLTSLPPEIGQLTSLSRLDVHGNKLTTLPEEMKNLAALEWLDVSFNDLESIPDEIRNKLNSKEKLIDYGNHKLWRPQKDHELHPNDDTSWWPPKIPPNVAEMLRKGVGN